MSIDGRKRPHLTSHDASADAATTLRPRMDAADVAAAAGAADGGRGRPGCAAAPGNPVVSRRRRAGATAGGLRRIAGNPSAPRHGALR